ncbi:MAG TPA: protein-disulfide reductase DsbD domain-containing protein [Candidatus Acidoferrum sp.]
MNFFRANSENRTAKLGTGFTALKLGVRFAAITVGALALTFAIASVKTPRAAAQVPSPKDVVAPTAFASYDPVARGKEFQIAVVMKIRDGFHVNARKKSAEYLIATDLKTDGATGFKIGDVTYPDGELRTFTFSKTPLNVYEETIVLKMAVTALPDAPAGAQHIPLKLRYQACNNEVCLPPVTLPVDATVNVTASASAAHPAHPDVFQTPR